MFEQSCRHFARFALVATLLASPAAPVFGKPQSLTLSCTGPFAGDSSEARLKRYFGARNVSWRSVDIGEGEFEYNTVLFARDTERRIVIHWSDRVHRRSISRLELRKAYPLNGADPAWRLSNGIGIGTSLAFVEALNGKAFAISGFGWDYGGQVLDWNGGALDALPGGCELGLTFEPTRRRDSSEVTGDREFWTTNPGMRELFQAVETIAITYRPRESSVDRDGPRF